MSTGGDNNLSPIEFPGIVYFPGFEAGISWATQYSSELSGALALSQGMYYLSNFKTRDILGRTAGICVNPFDFNMVKARRIDGTLARRPSNYEKTSYTPCDCSYHKCDRDFQGLGYTLDFANLWLGESGIKGLGMIFKEIGGSRAANPEDPGIATEVYDSLGFPKKLHDPNNNGNYIANFGGGASVKGFITAEQFTQYTTAIKNLDVTTSGSKETNLLTYAMIDFCGSVTAGIAFRNNVVSFLAFGQDVLEIGTRDYGDIENGEGDWNDVAREVLSNYEKNADIPGFNSSFVYTQLQGLENIQEKCMCIDAGMHGYDAYPFADNNIVNEQVFVDDDNIGGWDKFESLGFTGDKKDLARFLTIDGMELKKLGVTGAKSYKYGPNWLGGFGFSELNVISVSTPEFKNWESRNSGKIRISGIPNGEPYSFGNQWLEWGQRIGVPPIEYVPINPITLGGGDFVDYNFGYKGSLEGSLIYRGKLSQDVSVYEDNDYEFAFKGITTGNISTKKFFFGLTNIRHIDSVTNQDAYGISGSIEDIVFLRNFSESPQDKTLYRL